MNLAVELPVAQIVENACAERVFGHGELSLFNLPGNFEVAAVRTVFFIEFGRHSAQLVIVCVDRRIEEIKYGLVSADLGRRVAAVAVGKIPDVLFKFFGNAQKFEAERVLLAVFIGVNVRVVFLVVPLDLAQIEILTGDVPYNAYA